jgi:hypothetical protein
MSSTLRIANVVLSSRPKRVVGTQECSRGNLDERVQRVLPYRRHRLAWSRAETCIFIGRSAREVNWTKPLGEVRRLPVHWLPTFFLSYSGQGYGADGT